MNEQLWKLGCRWGAGTPLFFDLIKGNSVVIGWVDKDYKVGDWILVTDGYKVLDIAEVLSERECVLNFSDLEDDFKKLEIPYESRLFVYKAKFLNIKEIDSFQYELQQGIARVHNHKAIEQFIEIRQIYKMRDILEKDIKLLKYKKQIILQGPPGTGKTREAKLMAKEMIGLNDMEELANHEQFKIVQFHPSYTYEDFVRGIATIPNENGIEYQVVNRGIAEFANQALGNYRNSQKKGEEISYERAIIARYEAFKLELESELNDDKKINLTKAVDIVDFDEDSLLYIGHVWQGQAHRMHHKDIVNAYLSGNRSRQDIKQNMSLSGSARQHASYYVVILQKFCDYIAQNPINITSNSIEKEELQNYVMVIDEINRANLSSVLGELIYALEYRGKGIEGMYSKTDSDKIILPPNLYIIGTMNTADRSVGYIDYAIRRRFAFVDVLPQDLSGDSSITFDSELFTAVKELFTTDKYMTRSQYLSNEFDPKEVALGHSYFIDKSDEGGAMAIRLEYEIKPILREYIKDGILIGDGIIEKVEALKVEELKENV